MIRKVMKPFNTAIHDEITAHSILITAYIKSLHARSDTIAIKHNKVLKDVLSAHLLSSKTKNTTTKKWKTFEAKIKEIRKAMISDVKSDLSKDFSPYRRKESEYISGLFDELSPVIHKWKDATLNPIDSEMIFGNTIRKRFQIIETGDVNRVLFRVRSMFLAGNSPSQIIKAVTGVASLHYAGSLTGRTMSYLRSNTQTIISGLSEEVLDGFAEANKDVVKREVFVAILDSKTTDQCIKADGKVYLVGKGLFPPLHENCRSRRYPLVDGVAFVEGRFFYFKEDDGYTKMSFKSEAEKGSWLKRYIGGAPPDYTYAEFLRRQTPEFQNIVLGKKNAKLFRSGKLPVKKFANTIAISLTLDQLFKLYNKSFTHDNIKQTA